MKEAASSMYFSRSEYERRWATVLDEMRRRELDFALVWARGAGTHDRCANVVYLTNYYSVQPGNDEDCALWEGVGQSAVLLTARGDGPTLVCDMPEPSGIAADEVIHDWIITRGVAEAFKRHGVDGRVGLVGYSLIPAKYLDALRNEFPTVTFVDADDLLNEARRTKSSTELDCLRQGGEIFTEAMTTMLATAVRGGVTQAEAAAAGHAVAVARGATVFTPIGSGRAPYRWAEDVRTGASPAIPLAAGDTFRSWMYGPAFQGYWLDPGRTVVVGGKPTPRQREGIECAINIVDTLTAATKPGTRVRDLIDLGKRLRNASGTAEDQASSAWPVFGHGVGLFWEGPTLAFEADSMGNDEVIREGDALGLEVFLYWPDIGSVAMENNVIVGPDGCELITPIEVAWW